VIVWTSLPSSALLPCSNVADAEYFRVAVAFVVPVAGMFVMKSAAAIPFVNVTAGDATPFVGLTATTESEKLWPEQTVATVTFEMAVCFLYVKVQEEFVTAAGSEPATPVVIESVLLPPEMLIC